MPILGLVLRLRSNEADREALCARIEADPRLELGVGVEGRLPVVATTPETGDPERASLELHRELGTWPGVIGVEVVFTEVVPPSSGTRSARSP